MRLKRKEKAGLDGVSTESELPLNEILLEETTRRTARLCPEKKSPNGKSWPNVKPSRRNFHSFTRRNNTSRALYCASVNVGNSNDKARDKNTTALALTKYDPQIGLIPHEQVCP